MDQYKLVKADGSVYREYDPKIGWYDKLLDKGLASRKMHELDDNWFIVPVSYQYVRTMNGMYWGPAGQRGV